MAIYKKTVRVGKYAKKGEDYRDRDLITILNEGQNFEGKFGEEHAFKVRVPKGEEMTFRFNKTSINNMIDAFGEDSKGWIGQQVRVWLILQNVQGKMIKVAYVSHPDADIDDEGNFVLPPGIGNGNRGNVVDDEELPDIGDVIE